MYTMNYKILSVISNWIFLNFGNVSTYLVIGYSFIEV